MSTAARDARQYSLVTTFGSTPRDQKLLRHWRVVALSRTVSKGNFSLATRYKSSSASSRSTVRQSSATGSARCWPRPVCFWRRHGSGCASAVVKAVRARRPPADLPLHHPPLRPAPAPSRARTLVRARPGDAHLLGRQPENLCLAVQQRLPDSVHRDAPEVLGEVVSLTTSTSSARCASCSAQALS